MVGDLAHHIGPVETQPGEDGVPDPQGPAGPGHARGAVIIETDPDHRQAFVVVAGKPAVAVIGRRSRLAGGAQPEDWPEWMREFEDY